MPNQKHSYSIKGLDSIINKTIAFVFYYRLVVVTAALIGLFVLVFYTWNKSETVDKIKNSAAVITGGCVVIGIFYSLLNYENTLLKSRTDTQTSKEVLTYNAASRMYEKGMLDHSKIVRDFHTKHKSLIIQNKFEEVEAEMFSLEDCRTAYFSLFNYFEIISLGVEKGILDEEFMKEFFDSIFKRFYTYFGTFIVHSRREKSSPKMYIHFTTVAERWISQN